MQFILQAEEQIPCSWRRWRVCWGNRRGSSADTTSPFR